MINRKQLIDRFNMGMSVFSYYIKFNGICNLYDINIEAESFIGDICRILYGWDLRNENSVFQNNAGYDLAVANRISVTFCGNNKYYGILIQFQRFF